MKVTSNTYKSYSYSSWNKTHSFYNKTVKAISDISIDLDVTPQQARQIEKILDKLSETIKDQGTRKLRNAFVDYILDNSNKE